MDRQTDRTNQSLPNGSNPQGEMEPIVYSNRSMNEITRSV